MQIPFFNRLYVRIWLAVVLTVLVLTLAYGWLWRTQAERIRNERLAELPARELMVRDSSGKIIAQATARSARVPGQALEFQVSMPDGQMLSMLVPPRVRTPVQGAQTAGAAVSGSLLPRWLDTNVQRNPAILLWLWGMVAFSVALGSYPVVRRLTKRLEGLRQGVERWGAGDLRARVDVQGRDEVAFLAQRFNAAADRVEALVQSHKSLLANASHELRSPLARIRMGIELMHSAPRESLRAELARSISELDALIEEILLASRLDAAQHSTTIDLGKAETVDVIALAAEECARLNVSLTCQAQQLEVQGVPRLLRRLLRNLLDNAQRYGGSQVQMCLRTAPGSAVDNSADKRAGKGHTMEVEVCDRGPGVPEAEQQRIFEPFYRSTLASESEGGVGLGLALVQSIARSHGGAVHCHNRPGGGACFVVRLPGMHPVHQLGRLQNTATLQP
jgi:two-component system, OmpR family, sensor kinase